MTTEEETIEYMSNVAEMMFDRFLDRIRVKFPALDYTKTTFPYVELIPGDDETKGKSAIHYTLDKPIGEVSFEECTDRPRNHSIYGITVQCAYGCFARARFFPKPLPVSGTEPGSVLPLVGFRTIEGLMDFFDFTERQIRHEELWETSCFEEFGRGRGTILIKPSPTRWDFDQTIAYEMGLMLSPKKTAPRRDR